MPQNICSDCLAELSRLYGFKKQCEENEAILEALVNQTIEDGNDSEILKIEVIDDDDYEPTEITKNAILMENEWKNDNEKDTYIYPTKGKNDLAKGQVFKCSTCQASYPTLKKVREHKRLLKHAEYRLIKCEYCRKLITCKMLSVHLKCHGEKNYECDICYKKFAIGNNLKRHKMKHTNERPFVCAKCGKRFIQRVSLIAHEKTHDNVFSRTYDCAYCDRVFSRPCRLAKHMKGRHTSDIEHDKFGDWKTGEVHLCEICSAEFQTAPMLEIHLAEHAAKKYECEVCYKSFKSSFLLKTHSRTHTGEKPFTCATCGKSFAHSSNFKSHRSIHTGERPYKCSYCPLTFRQDPHLKHHLRTHTGEKPFKCPICGKSFAFKGNLTVHERIHTGLKPYVCSICQKGFYDSSSLKKHRWSHGQIQPMAKFKEIYKGIVVIE